MISPEDLKQINDKGIELAIVEKQISNFKRGFPFIRLKAAAIPSHGLHSFSEEEARKLAAYFDNNRRDYDILKFVPASGAASRMFKQLFEFMESYDGSPETIAALEAETDFNSVGYFLRNIHKQACYKDLMKVLEVNGLNIEQLRKDHDYNSILSYFLTDQGLNYAKLPKGLLQFHWYEDDSRYAVEEHLVEAANYSTDNDKVAKVHLTVSPEHQQKFESAIADKKAKHEDHYGVTFDVNFSQQKPATDTIAVDMDNEPFRTSDGSLLFRPGGHGALIENLNDLDQEIIFVKNIDNIVPDRLRETTYLYKKVIGGLLMQLQEKAFEALDMLEDGNLSDDELTGIKEMAELDLNIFIPEAYEGYDNMDKIDFLFNKLNRPMRICGMVKNEGEPGGGPFWVLNENEEASLQIVESSQINLDDLAQKEIVSSATHFNPVDLVCGVKDFKGEAFDLKEFVDPNTGFISVKSQGGKNLKAQELPGLWNGAMADWITVFVETPLITFNPVKTINDLLRTQHQPE